VTCFWPDQAIDEDVEEPIVLQSFAHLFTYLAGSLERAVLGPAVAAVAAVSDQESEGSGSVLANVWIQSKKCLDDHFDRVADRHGMAVDERERVVDVVSVIGVILDFTSVALQTRDL
jgi:hypothetical protein